jgi:hypothetical protein
LRVSLFLLWLEAVQQLVEQSAINPKFGGLNPATVKMTKKKAYCVDLASSGNTVTNNS